MRRITDPSSRSNWASGLRTTIASFVRAVGHCLTAGGASWIEAAGPIIVFAPHPDDEVLGCGGTIALQVHAGADVRVVMMTDGRASHAGFLDPAELARVRRGEALAACRALGLRPTDYRFLDFEDGRLREFGEVARDRVAQILGEIEPRYVFVPHRRDKIDDHVATFEIVTAALRERGKPVTVLEYPVWLWNSWPWTASGATLGQLMCGCSRLVRDVVEIAFGCSIRVDVRSVHERKVEALAKYASQVRRPPGCPEWPILADVSGGTFLACFLRGEEIFRRTEVGH